MGDLFNPLTHYKDAKGKIHPKLDARETDMTTQERYFMNANKVNTLRPKTSAERKLEPIHTGVMLYFPDALAAVARISVAGNNKHNPGEPLHWARGKSIDQMDALARHSLTMEQVDPETGEVEAAAMIWRGLAQLQLIEEKRLKAAGIMPYSGIVP